MPSVSCEICSAAFHVKPSHLKRRRFCSKQCAGVWHAKGRLKALWAERGARPLRSCVRCGKGFRVPRGRKAKYCQAACYNAARSDAPQKHRAGLPCLRCGQRTVGRDKKFCCRECRLAHWGRQAMVKVACVDCGAVRTVTAKVSSVRCKPCGLRNRAGAANSNWRGGKKSESAKIRASDEYKAWRKAVFERDRYTCQWCGQVGGELNADHIKSFARHPELRLELSNGRTLCVPCHKKTDTYLSAGRWPRRAGGKVYTVRTPREALAAVDSSRQTECAREGEEGRDG